MDASPRILIDRKATKEDIENLSKKMDKELEEYKELVKFTKLFSSKRKPYMMNQSEGNDNVEVR